MIVFDLGFNYFNLFSKFVAKWYYKVINPDFPSKPVKEYEILLVWMLRNEKCS
jgi:hypothetical protein